MIQKSPEGLPSGVKADENGTVAFAERFADLTREWKSKKKFLSSVSQMAMLPSYQQIIGMGLPALPFIFNELERQPDHWFWALASITGDDPVSPEHRGKIALMTEDWLNWARSRGYLN